MVALSDAVARTTSSVSRTIDVKSAVASDWKTIAALPREVISSPVSNVTYAVLMANSRSSRRLVELAPAREDVQEAHAGSPA